jgi:hypothetical protein
MRAYCSYNASGYAGDKLLQSSPLRLLFEVRLCCISTLYRRHFVSVEEQERLKRWFVLHMNKNVQAFSERLAEFLSPTKFPKGKKYRKSSKSRSKYFPVANKYLYTCDFPSNFRLTSLKSFGMVQLSEETKVLISELRALISE